MTSCRDLSAVLAKLKLAVEEVIERNEKFLLLKCADDQKRAVVLKYSHSGSKKARVRLNNEAIVIKSLKPAKPLRFLKYRTHGPDYVVTEFERGELLLPNSGYEEGLRKTVADALIAFQRLTVNARDIGVKQQTSVKGFYFKGMLKHLLHLWPDHVSLSEAVKCLWILVSSLPLMSRIVVVCHGDMLPTNLIYRAVEGDVVFTDLEGFSCENHPLYDVLSFCTIDDARIGEWEWQKRFIRYYLDRTGEPFRVDSQPEEFKKVMRAVLVFLLLYRLNETRISGEGTAYFEGRGKFTYVLRKLTGLLANRIPSRACHSLNEAMAMRKENLKTVLSRTAYTHHVSWLLDGSLSASPKGRSNSHTSPEAHIQ